MALQKWARRALWGVAALAVLAGGLAGLGWAFVAAMEQAMDELPGIAAESTEGDGLSAFALSRWTESETTRARLLREAVVAAETDWRVLALIADHHPVDLSLGTDEVRARLNSLAGDNAYVHLQRMENVAHCCAHHDEMGGRCCQADFAEAAAAASDATHYESPGPQLQRSLVERFDQIPGRRFGWLTGEAAKEAATQTSLWSLTTDSRMAPLSGLEQPCTDADDATRTACAHLAELVLRDSDEMFDQMAAAVLLAASGTPAQRELAAARRSELDWLHWHRRRLWETASFGDHDEPLATATSLPGLSSLAANRALLASRDIALVPPAGWTVPKEADAVGD